MVYMFARSDMIDMLYFGNYSASAK